MAKFQSHLQIFEMTADDLFIAKFKLYNQLLKLNVTLCNITSNPNPNRIEFNT